MGPRYDLDVVAHLFVTNDPGDQYYELQSARSGKVTVKPSAVLDEDAEAGFEIVLPPEMERGSLANRTSLFAARYSMAARVIRGLLKQALHEEIAEDRGNPDAEPPETDPRAAPDPTRIPNQNDSPSTWPPETLAEAQTLGRRILASFRDEVEGAGRHFIVLYVPRGERELAGQYEPADSWHDWLFHTCNELGIPFIDLLPALREARLGGEPMYNDHWTPAGHAVVANRLQEYLASRLQGQPGS